MYVPVAENYDITFDVVRRQIYVVYLTQHSPLVDVPFMGLKRNQININMSCDEMIEIPSPLIKGIRFQSLRIEKFMQGGNLVEL